MIIEVFPRKEEVKSVVKILRGRNCSPGTRDEYICK